MAATATRETTTWRYLVAGHDGPGEPYPSEAEAVAAAKGRPESWVVCLTESGGYATRQRVWPTVGPVYAGHD